MGNVWSRVESAASKCWNFVKKVVIQPVLKIVHVIVKKVVHVVVKKVVQQCIRYFYNQKGKIIIDIYSDCF